jgi:hypothetical protein
MKAFHRYYGNQTVRIGDTIATSRMGTCIVRKITKDIVHTRNTCTNEKIDLCGIALSDSDLIDRKKLTK